MSTTLVRRPSGRRQRKFARSLPAVVVTLGTLGPTSIATAQHASDNPILSADDAFGITLGTETIGIYGPGDVRYFSPQVAGNVRIDGLYFDQQGLLSNRVVEGSTVHVGLSAIGYAFPAPTGIVDYDLRHAGDKPMATVILGLGPYENRAISVDGRLPLMSEQLTLPMGAGYQVAAAFPGYTSSVTSFGVAPLWKIDRFSFRAFFDWQRTSDAKTLPLVFTTGDFLPPNVRPGYRGQNWAKSSSLSENYGGTAHVVLSSRWALATGVFRSISNNPITYADLYVNAEPSGLAQQELVATPDQRTASTSGEIRLNGHFSEATSYHDIVFLARARDASALYGGSDAVSVGPALISEGAQVARPDFIFSDRTHDHTQQWSTGVAYHGRWPGSAEVTLGIQLENYRKEVTSPEEATSRLTERPIRTYGTFAATVTDRTTLYAGYTQGLEDSGVAPSTAANRGAVLPASETWQLDGGVRHNFASNFKVIAGVFKVNKPYFNLDARNVDRQLGMQQAEGLEVSIAGNVNKDWVINAGAVLGHVKVIGPSLSAEGVGSTAIGEPHFRSVADANYSFRNQPTLSADLSIVYFGTAPANVDNRVKEPATTTLNLGGRYQFPGRRTPTTLRLQIQNLANVRVWNIGYSPGYFQYPPPRGVLAYLTTDIR
jgi:iron complex outermembrane receptor protein